MIKCQDIFLDHFARLGVFCKIQQLIGPNNNSENDNVKQVDVRQVCVNFNVMLKIICVMYYLIKNFFLNLLESN